MVNFNTHNAFHIMYGQHTSNIPYHYNRLIGGPNPRGSLFGWMPPIQHTSVSYSYQPSLFQRFFMPVMMVLSMIPMINSWLNPTPDFSTKFSPNLPTPTETPTKSSKKEDDDKTSSVKTDDKTSTTNKGNNNTSTTNTGNNNANATNTENNNANASNPVNNNTGNKGTAAADQTNNNNFPQGEVKDPTANTNTAGPSSTGQNQSNTNRAADNNTNRATGSNNTNRATGSGSTTRTNTTNKTSSTQNKPKGKNDYRTLTLYTYDIQQTGGQWVGKGKVIIDGQVYSVAKSASSKSELINLLGNDLSRQLKKNGYTDAHIYYDKGKPGEHEWSTKGTASTQQTKGNSAQTLPIRFEMHPNNPFKANKAIVKYNGNTFEATVGDKKELAEKILKQIRALNPKANITLKGADNTIYK